MTTQIVLWTILALPLLLGITFRVGAPHLFFSLMAGELLARYFGHDVEKIAAENLTRQAPERYGEIILVLAAMLLTAFFMRGTVSKSRVMLHVIPLAITGIIMAAFLLPLMPAGIQSEISNTFIGGWILNLNRAIIGVVVVVQLVSLWLFGRLEKKKKKKKKKNHE